MFTTLMYNRRLSNDDEISTNSQLSLFGNSPHSSHSSNRSSSSSITDNYDLLAAYDNAIKSFCPNILLSEINTKGVEVRSIYFTGVCMLADISGFTKLSNELGKDGNKGLDRLRKATSGFLSKFIYLVYSYGGDVISFAGDALICIFRDLPGMTPCESKRKAVECGFKLKEHCTDQLSAHIAITAGEMCFALLGGYMNNWVYVMNGQCVQELSQCIDDAKSKELVVSEYLYSKIPEHYRAHLQVSVLPSGNVIINGVHNESVNQLEENICFADRFEISSISNTSFTVGILGFLPTTVVSSMTAGSFKNISELRVVTTMFLKLDSYSPERSVDLTNLQPFFHMAQEAIFLSGGVLRQFLVDDKGCVLIALWGVPSASYSNNANRALVCATTIFEKSQLLGEITSIGITTGQCFCGTIGSILRRDYVAIGDSVNMAARLMSKAHGRILIDESTYSSLPISIREKLSEGEPLMLKGRSTPLTPYTFRSNNDEFDVLNRGILSLNFTSKVSHQSSCTTASLSSSSDDSVFMTLPKHRSLKFATKRFRSDLLESSENNETSATEFGEQFQRNNEQDMIMQSNLDPDIERSLNDHIKHLLNLQGNIVRQNSILPTKKVKISPASQPRCRLVSSKPVPLMKYIVVHGQQGTGKSEVAKYFRRLSLQHKVRCFYIKAVEDDLVLEYGVFRRLFISLLGPNAFRTTSEEQRSIISLLKITYPHLPDKVLMTLKFPVIKDILGLQWDLNYLNGALVGVPEKMVAKAYQQIRQSYFSKYKDNTMMSDMIRSLLMNIPTTIIIDDAHFCDTLTWRELSFITSADLPLVTLLTMRPPPLSYEEIEQLIHQETNYVVSQETPNVLPPNKSKAMDKYGSLIGRFFRNENRVHPSARAEEQTLRRLAASNTFTPPTPAASACQHLVTSNPNGTLLKIGPLSRDQISNILISVLSRDDISPELIDIVLEVSSGNAFWARSIAEYVSQFGYEAFIRSVGVTAHHLDEKVNADDTESVTVDDKSISPHSHPSNYAITPSFRKHGALNFADKTLRKSMKPDIEHESNHLRLYIVSLVDQLSISDSTILKYASLIGVSFCSQILKQILPQSFQKSDTLESSLISLEERGFIIKLNSEGTIYHFQNHRFREIVYDFTPPSDASRLHFAIAKVIEKNFDPTKQLTCEALTYHYNNAIPTDSTMQVYKEALKYALLTASLFIRMGNFSLALNYLEYAESIAQKNDEYVQIMTILKTAEDMVHLSFSEIHENPSQLQKDNSSITGNQIANMFYNQNTLGSNIDDFMITDYVQLYDRISQKITTLVPQSTAENGIIDPLITKKPSEKEIQLHSPSQSAHVSMRSSFCIIS